MELHRKVHLAWRQGMSEHAAARHFGISRESVRKMLRFSVPPGYRRTAWVRRPKPDGFTELIDQWLEEDRKRPRKQRHTAKRVFEGLRTEYGLGGEVTAAPLTLVRERPVANWRVSENPVSPASQAASHQDQGDAPATEVARPSTHADAGRIGAPPPARVRLMSPRTMIRLATLNNAPIMNAGV